MAIVIILTIIATITIIAIVIIIDIKTNMHFSEIELGIKYKKLI